MNERIDELMIQATTKISFRLDPNTYKHIDDPDGDLERFEFDKQKFAELIVKQTMQVVANQLPSNQYLDVADAVIKHFGVEE